MSKDVTNEDAVLLNHLQKKSITDLTIQLQPRLSRLKKRVVPPRKPSEDELRSLEWGFRAPFQARPPSRKSRDPASFRCLTTTHHFLAGLSVEEDPNEWTEEPSSCSFFAKAIRWAKEDDASLGIGVAVGDFYGCTYSGGTVRGLEVSSAWSAFRFNHQLLPERERPLFPTGYRLRLTVKAEVPIPGNLWNYMILNPVRQGELVGVKGEITIFLKATAVMIKTVPFLYVDVCRDGHYNRTRWEVDPRENPFVSASAEISAPSDMTSYEAVIFINLMAFRSEGGGGFAAINLAGPDAGMWWYNTSGAGPVIVYYVSTKLCRELQVAAPDV